MIGTYAALKGTVDLQEGYRHECEVRYVAGFATDAQRSVYLEGVKGVRDVRGDAAADRLRRDVWTEMKARGAEAQPIQEGLFA